jgi:hypothetical protein
MMRATFLVTSLALTTAGCESLICGEGTFREGRSCVAYDPNDTTPPVTTLTPPGGRSRDPLPETIRLTTDEPARIIYTTDGSDPDPEIDPGETSPVTIVEVAQGMTVKYMAIDRAGNREAIGSTVYDSDRTPPAPVSGLTVEVTGTTAVVTWTNPTDPDFESTVVARVADIVDVTPAPGQVVTAGMALSPSLEVLAVGTMTTLTDPGRPPGRVRYVAWTVDDVGNYSAGVAAGGEISLGSLSALLTYDTATNTLALASTPPAFDLSATTAQRTGSTLTVTLSVKNNAFRNFQNPKAEVVAITNGAFTGADGQADGHPFRSLGPETLAVGATVTRDLVFTGVTGTVTIDLTFAHHPTMLLTNSRSSLLGAIDLGSGNLLPPVATNSPGPNDNPGRRTFPGVLIADRFLDVPTCHGEIERIDLATRSRVNGLILTDANKANVQGLFRVGTDTVAVVKRDGYRRTGQLELVKVDESLQVVQRLALPHNDDRGFARPAVSEDGRTMALATAAGIALIDLTTLTQIDANPSTPELDLIPRPLSGVRLKSLVFFDGTDGILVMGRTYQVAILRKVGDAWTSSLYSEASTGSRGFVAARGPDGRVWLAFSLGLRVFDPATGTTSSTSYAGGVQGVANIDGQMWVIRSARNVLDRVSSTGVVEQTVTLPSTGLAYGHWLTIAR